MRMRFQSRTRAAGFTLIELLVAMAILVILVMLVAQFFQQATVAWDTGTERVEINMTGRALADYMAQEMSQAVSNSSYPIFDVPDGGDTAEFIILGLAQGSGLRSGRRVRYFLSGDQVMRQVMSFPDGSTLSDQAMADKVLDLKFFVRPAPIPPGGLPLYVDVRVTLTNQVFESRACFLNRDRYRM